MPTHSPGLESGEISVFEGEYMEMMLMRMNEVDQALLDQVVARGVANMQGLEHEPPRTLIALLKLGWKQRELAEALHLSESQLSKWCSGATPILIKYLPVFKALLRETLAAYDVEIERARKQGKWTRRAAQEFRELLDASRGALAWYPSPGKW